MSTTPINLTKRAAKDRLEHLYRQACAALTALSIEGRYADEHEAAEKIQQLENDLSFAVGDIRRKLGA